MNGALLVAVDSSAIMKENTYYIKYKNKTFKYIKSNHPRRMDWMFGFYIDNDQDETYRIMTEFLRAFSFRNNIKTRLSAGSVHQRLHERDIKTIEIGYSEYKGIASHMHIPGFYYISSIDSHEKSELLRLFTEADANDNLFFKFLFFWHTIVYPSANDTDAIRYINDAISEIIDEDDTNLKYIKASNAFGAFDANDIGRHFHDQIRHAIAHIVRNRTESTNLSIDNLKQYRHINAAIFILQKIARHRLWKDFKFNIDAEESIFQTFIPD